MSTNFKSDNVTPVCEPIMAAIAAANVGAATSYGADEYTHRLQTVAAEVFGHAVAIFPVTTGTAANALALAHMVPPFGAVYCFEAAHIATDECAAPEFFTGGAKMLGLPAADGKILPDQVASAVVFAEEMGIHHVKPAAVSITQATEWGTVYTPAQIAAIAAVVKRNELPLHMDGARFANAVAHLNCSPADATWKSGVDVLSLGATKNGALGAEAVVFFDPKRAADFERRRKRAGHLWSKMRYVSAQLLAYLENDLWLKNARHANAMGSLLGRGLQSVEGASLLQPVEANEVFVVLPETTIAALEAQDFGFYRWPAPAPARASVPSGAIRLVTSYATPRAAVEEFIAAAQRCN